MYRKNQHVLIFCHQTSLEFLPFYILANSKAIFTKSKAAAILFTPLKTAALIYRFYIWFNYYYMCMVPFFVKSSKNSNYFRRLLKSTFRGSLINTIIYSKKNIVLFNLVWWTVTKKIMLFKEYDRYVISSSSLKNTFYCKDSAN